MPAASRSSDVPLDLSVAQQWTLHHLLLERLEREATAGDGSGVEPPPLAVHQAFERCDAGEIRFTSAQLEAIQTVLAAVNEAPGRDRAAIETLQRRVATALETASTTAQRVDER